MSIYINNVNATTEDITAFKLALANKTIVITKLLVAQNIMSIETS